MNPANDRFFMAGICGMGMGPLALYLKAAGYTVAGSDDKPRGEVCRRLRAAGIPVNGGAHIPEGTTRLVFSSAVSAAHPLRREAEARGIPMLRRGELLAEISRGHRTIAIVGSHGKTTTCGMLIRSLRANRVDASHVLGGLFQDETMPPARFTQGTDWLVAEVDESDGTIEGFLPEITLAVNFDWDHPDRYRTQADLEAAFRRLFERTSGAVVIPSSCPVLARLVEGLPRVVRYGQGGDWSVTGGGTWAQGMELSLRDAASGEVRPVRVRATGPFNRHNALACLAATGVVAAGMPVGDSLADFPGIRRRQGLLHEDDSMVILEDYAHHPTEIDALLVFARERWAGRRMVVAFQPHRYTRTLQYRDEFARVLDLADAVVVKEVYAASEPPLEGGRTGDIVSRMRKPGVLFARDFDGCAAFLDAEAAGAPSVVLFIGAGDIDVWGHAYAAHRKNVGRWFDEARSGLSAATHVATDEPMGPKTTIGTGGAARWFAEPADEADLARLLGHAHRARVPVFLLGRGSNLLVPDSGYDGLVIRLAGTRWKEVESLGNGRIRAGAGAMLKRICAVAEQNGLAGLEFIEGIPGTLGGALRMNAGAMGGWIFDLVEEVTLMLPSGEVRSLPGGAFTVGYRTCRELEHAIALSSVLRAPGTASPAEIHAGMEEFARRRRATQPREASAGCVFRNPKGGHAGRLVDECGLKGASRGGARVSDVHANFIVNAGGATSADIVELVRAVRDGVLERTGVRLEPEVIIPGNDWEELLNQATGDKGTRS